MGRGIESAYYEKLIRKVCDDMANFLIAKNQAYGNSIFEPANIFSKASVEDLINTRMDDKLSRIMKGKEFAGDDTMKDLVGYYLIKQVYNLWKQCYEEEK